MNERVAMLRKQSLETVPYIDITRARLYTEAYKLYEGTVSVPELRAKAFYHYMQHRPLCINPGELIVGEKGDGPQGAPTFPELCCHTLEDLEILDTREKIFFRVSPEVKRIQAEEIIPYWEKRSMRSRIFAHMDEEWLACYRAGIFTEFMEQRGPGHTVGGDVFYKKGFWTSRRRSWPIWNPWITCGHGSRRQGRTVAGHGHRLRRHHALWPSPPGLRPELAEKETDPVRRQELLQIAENCSVVPQHAPRTFWQALQMYWFVHIGVTTELNPWDAFSPGRLDQHLYPFYKQDVAAGLLDDDKALELLECLWVKFHNQPAPPKVGVTLKESSTYTDFANINTGGIAPDGSDGQPRQLPHPAMHGRDAAGATSSNVQISRKTPQKFLLRPGNRPQGLGQPAFYNTEAIIQQLLNAGKTIEDAQRRAADASTGCLATRLTSSPATLTAQDPGNHPQQRL